MANQQIPPLKFVEAIEWAKARGVVLPSVYYGQLQGLARSMSFSIAGLSSAGQLQLVLDRLVTAMEEGQSFAQWKKSVKAGDVNLNLPDYRIENIYRTNIQGHYNRGRCEQQRENDEFQPWRLYDAVNDSRTRPSHAAMDGFVARHDDPIWDTWTPTNGYQCRCRLIALTDKEVGRFQEADDKKTKDPDEEIARADAIMGGPDKGWNYNVCSEPDEGVKRAIDNAVVKMDEPISEALLQRESSKLPPWQWLNPLNADLDTVKKVGRDRFDELLGFVLPDDSTVPMINFRGKKVGDLLAEDWELLSYNVVPALRANMMEMLREVRSVGTVKPNALNKSGKGLEVINRAASKYPDDWVSKGNFKPLRVLISKARGHFIHRKYDKPTKTYNSFIRTTDSSTAEHEYAHHLQHWVDGLDELFQAEHNERTASDLLEILYHWAPGETGKPDKYVNRYTGREYGSEGALEIMSMAFQAILGDDRKANNEFAKMLWNDSEMLALALGVLFHWSPL